MGIRSANSGPPAPYAKTLATRPTLRPLKLLRHLLYCIVLYCIVMYCIVLYLYIYIALLAVDINQKRFQCGRPWRANFTRSADRYSGMRDEPRNVIISYT